MKFTELDIHPQILKALEEKNYINPTPIQEKAIPVILEKKDILACAQTGTGKTAAFCIPILDLVAQSTNNKVEIKSLIVTPTRELAIQIGENLTEYSKHLPIYNTVIFGGVKQNKQVERLKRGVHVLVATPGRLLDLIDQGYISLKALDFFVLDEADRMLDMGFIHDIKKLLRIIPQKRQSLFFSATLPENIIQLSKTILNSPVTVKVSPVSSTAETIQQYIYYTNRASKKELLQHILKDEKMEQVLVFSRTKRGADKITKGLKAANIMAAAIHGDKSQPQRQRALSQFKDGSLRVLVATDIAARGIDINKLQFVINYDIPNIPETYVHRIGRSGRAGAEGVAISICEPEENEYVRDIEKLTGKKISAFKQHPFPQTEKPMTAAEKKEWNKEKQRRKQEFFTNRNKKRGSKAGGKKGNNNRR